ncbi:protein of unknown function [Taphrina deformans PYCC 5710]|uniref:Uncharacterized protein n=1 Tax=Taphrina deformans (strain PYCC 5710 / ATCC 11124 / CBS 356.35 / IMI 108563 / JCM 9778 / NBRC 8474) TaxID=1097556 RepID=R4XKQ0_TAPDE|nr:protein of unknown function [Taphrina deformans PYCC 5710]|eukprot:CCG83894.1 protein of unknown function [Taphrina deformans PYCC 5710]
MTMYRQKGRPALPPKPAFLSKTLRHVKEGHARYTNCAIALGLANFHELSFVTGELLNLECTPIESDFPAWGIATRSNKADTERGLVPLEYLQLLDEYRSSIGSGSDALSPIIDVESLISDDIDFSCRSPSQVTHLDNNKETESVQSTIISRPDYLKLLGGRELNRFSKFVRTGVEV